MDQRFGDNSAAIIDLRTFSFDRRGTFARLFGYEEPEAIVQLSSRINKMTMICQILGTQLSCMKAAPAMFDWAGRPTKSMSLHFLEATNSARKSKFEAGAHGLLNSTVSVEKEGLSSVSSSHLR